MKVGFIGAGKVGFSLGKYLVGHGVVIVGYQSLHESSAQEAAAFAGGRAFKDAAALIAASEMVFLTVPDDGIAGVWADIARQAAAGEVDVSHKSICHCSGALSSAVFDGVEQLGGWGYSIHPLFAINSKYDSYAELGKAFFAIEGSAAHIDGVAGFMRGLGNEVQVIHAADKVRYHAAAVMASNLVIALYSVAVDQLVECGFGRPDAERALKPLFIGNAQHIVGDGIVASLTGPAERGDTMTIQKHLACLDGYEREIYRLLTDKLYDIAAVKHTQPE